MSMRPRLIALAASALLLAACGGEQEQPAPPPPEVGVVTVQPSTVPMTKDLVGRLGAYRSADVRARVPGVVQRRVYEEGSDVSEGDVLFVIDPAPFQADLSAAQASLARAEANAANARSMAERARRLAPENFISRSDLDNALAAERSATAAVQAARASVDSARINLGYATVRAPISGRAGKQQVTEGALVGQGTATLLTTVDQIDPLYVNFSLSLAELEDLRGRQLQNAGPVAVEVLLQDGSVYPHPGELDFSGDVVDPATGAVSLRATLPNPDRRLLPGAYVTLQATMGEQSGLYLLPQRALQRDAVGGYVMVVGADGKVARRDVTVDRAQAGQWVVSQGLSPGEQVIVSGLQRVRPDAQAVAVPWQPTVPGAAAGAPGAGAAAGAAATAPAEGAGAAGDAADPAAAEAATQPSDAAPADSQD
ncbi:efflux RND transporter periplasmic adaptor subunit [Luteimonas yindakuii]|uniref:efflux RND transporter periplasmic adaptor subunit n=1 Tax=Luteimonas yindakuii TaxID=2565782 RepID=UPI0010A4C620|nr:efflux RND transporter periplasmic adaptor subunit [Luteimonas yindakuii]QCO66960.1 efflux RND transporter periplasmic adaptor subunit [Luteimonas yindakuii]